MKPIDFQKELAKLLNKHALAVLDEEMDSNPDDVDERTQQAINDLILGVLGDKLTVTRSERANGYNWAVDSILDKFGIKGQEDE